ncbi:MAG: hypothetical protein NXH79_10555 [Rhodobacteraceae bacterium]|nr:hypothetical protein [Paracoccaceae bacterium]
MTRASLAAAALLVVAACVQTPNDVAEGVGFQDYQAYQARRAMLRGETLTPPETVRPPSPVVASPVLTTGVRPVAPAASAAPAVAPATDPLAAIAANAIAEAEAGTPTAASRSAAPTAVALASAPAPSSSPAAPPAPATASAAPPAATPRGNAGISDEQNFDAVAARETIESDAERLARMQAERVEVAPTALPTRSGDTPSIVAFALETTHPVGTRLYSRNPLNRGRQAEACRAFRAPDLAQEWFLANGGPARDRRALDPDGDGFACDWNPEIYRAAARSAAN